MNIKRVLVILIFLAATFTGSAQTGEDYNTYVQRIYEYYNSYQTDSIYNLFSANLKAAMPRDKTIKKINELHSRTGNMTTYSPVIEKEGVVFYTTTFSNTVLSLMIKLKYNDDGELLVETFRFIPYQRDSTPFSKSNFFYTAPTGNIYGTLTEPAGMNKVPIVIIIPGAGPVDRNGNNMYGLKANTYSLIADSLQKLGIACLRYDKRGIAESAPALKIEDDLTFDDMINDATWLTKRIKQHWRFTKVFLMGHGEGSLIAMKVAEEEKVNGYISISGAADRADKLLENQIKEQSKKLAKKAAIVFDSIGKGFEVHVTDSALSSVFNESIQKYLASWMKYSPLEEIKKLTVPILILQGTTDMQTSKKDAKKLKEANPKATVNYIENMNYVMKYSSKDKKENISTYTNDNLPLCPGLIPAITQFVKNTQ